MRCKYENRKLHNQNALGQSAELENRKLHNRNALGQSAEQIKKTHIISGNLIWTELINGEKKKLPGRAGRGASGRRGRDVTL